MISCMKSCTISCCEQDCVVLLAPYPNNLSTRSGTGATAASSTSLKVNIWMWRYGWGRSRMVSIAEAKRMRRERLSESRRAAETRKRRSEVAAVPQRGLPRATAGGSWTAASSGKRPRAFRVITSL